MKTYLKETRKATGLTQEKAAELSGIPLGTLRRWEQGVNEPDMGSIIKLAELYGTTTDTILGSRHADSTSRFSNIPGAKPVRGVPTVKVPLVGRVHAGPAGDPDVYEDVDEPIDIPQGYLDIDPECVAVDFEGDCMLPDFGDATTLVVSPNSPFGNGSIVIASIDGADYVVRRMEQSARELRLRASNSAYDDIVIPRDEEHEVEFKGKVLGCFRRFD